MMIASLFPVCRRLILLFSVVALAACQPEVNPPVAPVMPAVEKPTPVPAVVPSEEPVTQLAYLRDGDIWLYDFATNSESSTTDGGNILAYVWSPDGARMATYDGQQLCFVALAVQEQRQPCRELGTVERDFGRNAQIIWSPDEQFILVMHSEWWLVDLMQKDAVYHIVEPMDWGMVWPDGDEDGGFSMPAAAVFLDDGSLLGSVAHSFFCGSGGCWHHLAAFDPVTQRFGPSNLSNLENGGGGEVGISANGRILVNYGTSHVGCAFYNTYVTFVDLERESSHEFYFEQEAFYDLSLSADGRLALIAQGEGCGAADRDIWSIDCGLSDAFEIYSLQLWTWAEEERLDLPPGLEPAWSGSDRSIAFSSCLAQTPSGNWEPIAAGPPWVYALHFTDDDFTVEPIAVGQAPAWRPR
jgi:hypothetical protein